MFMSQMPRVASQLAFAAGAAGKPLWQTCVTTAGDSHSKAMEHSIVDRAIDSLTRKTSLDDSAARELARAAAEAARLRLLRSRAPDDALRSRQLLMKSENLPIVRRGHSACLPKRSEMNASGDSVTKHVVGTRIPSGGL